MNRETVRENRLLSEEVLNCLPEYCEVCGSAVEFDDGLRMYCSNETCPSKIAERISRMARYLEVDGFGYATGLEIATEMCLTSPLQLFYYNAEDLSGCEVAALDKKMKDLHNARTSRKFQLSELVRMADLDGIETSADKIFKGYESFEHFYNDLERDGAALLATKLVVSGQVVPMVMAVYETLLNAKDELMELEERNLFELESLDGKVIEVAITGKLGNGLTKSKFIQQINQEFGDRFKVSLATTVNKNINVLITDEEDSSSTKMKSALKLQEKGYDISIMTSLEFLETLRGIQ